MKTKALLVVVVSTMVIVAGVMVAAAQGPKPLGPLRAAADTGTGFTYQGQLKSSGVPVNGACNIAFRLYDASGGGNIIGIALTPTVAVTNGVFTTLLDFGAGAFTGDARWLDMQVKCPPALVYVPLTPRQALTPAPLALALPGLWTQQNGTSPNLIGGYSGNVISPSVVGATIGGGGAAGSINRIISFSGYATIGGGAANTVSASSATVGGGVTNTASGVGATVAGGEYNTASSNDATVGGGSNNTANSSLATVGGGAGNKAIGLFATVGGGNDNSASSGNATVGGGVDNTADYVNTTVGGGSHNTAGSADATVGGGELNTASGGSATVGGGYSNTASIDNATVGGGLQNNATGSATTVGGGESNSAGGQDATVGGGKSNSASSYAATASGGAGNIASGGSATVGGGYSNIASGTAATVGGGSNNTASGDYSFAAGQYANTNNMNGTFVWGDRSVTTEISATAPNQFLIRSTGGVGINTDAPVANGLTVNGQVVAGGTTAPAGLEPFTAEGANSGISMNDRVGGNPRWVVYPEAGELRLYNAINGSVVKVGTGGILTATGFSGQCLKTGQFSTSAANACNMDVAEAFASADRTEPGDVVALVSQPDGGSSPAAGPTVHKAGRADGTLVVGVVSSNPGLVFDNGQTHLAGDNSQLITADRTVVAVVGRVPVKVSLENGPIAVGDPLTGGSAAGTAMKATQAGQIIGYALQSSAELSDGKLLAWLQPGLYVPPQQVAELNANSSQPDSVALTAQVAQLQARNAALESRASAAELQNASIEARMTALEQARAGDSNVPAPWLLFGGMIVLAAVVWRRR